MGLCSPIHTVRWSERHGWGTWDALRFKTKIKWADYLRSGHSLCQERLVDMFLHSGRPSNFSASKPTAKFLTMAAFLVLYSLPNFGFCADKAEPSLHNLFHLVGIPGLHRDERVDLIPGADALHFKTKRVQYQVPYARIHQVLVLRADRRYEGRTYAAAVATFGVGGLLILKKHHVDTVVLDYVNERGGKMGIVVQMERTESEQLKEILTSHTVSIVEPEGIPESHPTEKTGVEATERSKQ